MTNPITRPMFTADEYDAGMRSILEMLERNDPRETPAVQALADRLMEYEAHHYPLDTRLGQKETKGFCGEGCTTCNRMVLYRDRS